MNKTQYNKLKKRISAISKTLGRIPNKTQYDKLRGPGFPSEWSLRNSHDYKWSAIINDVFGVTRAIAKGFSRENLNLVMRERKEVNKRYFVTAAIAGAQLDEAFFATVNTFCKANKAKLVILPMRGINKSSELYDDSVKELEKHFATEYFFNSNLVAMDLKLSPQQINPLAGLSRLGQKDYSIIIASPKQEMKSIATGNMAHPHLLHSTGVITKSQYGSSRSGLLANQDHVIGGLIVEIADDKTFFIRQVQSGKHGDFYDLNKYYNGKVIKNIKAEAFILGDYHSGVEDPTAVNAWKEITNLVDPHTLVFHDIYDGRSTNHHCEKNMTEKGRRPLLEDELLYTGKALSEWSKLYPKKKLLVVRSNHDEFLDRYLQECRYAQDSQNYRLALTLAGYQYDYGNPIKCYLDKMKFDLRNVTWLGRDHDIKIAGINVGNHGDLGANGSRGNPSSIELAYGNAIVGHSHSPSILRKVWTVGTTSKLKLSYNRGPSSWLHASCIVYKNGQRQMIISIKGKWRI